MTFLRSIRYLLLRGQYTVYAAIVEKIAFFLFFVALARRLSVGEYGGIVASFAACNVLLSFFEFGFPVYFQREAAARNGGLAYEFRSALLLRLSLALIYPAALLLLTPAGAALPVHLLAMIAASVYLFGISGMYAGLLYGFEAYAKHFAVIFISRIFLVAVAAFFFCGGFAAEVAISGVLLSAIIQCGALALLVGRMPERRALDRREPGAIRRVLRSSLPIGAGLVFVWIYDKVDVILIQRLLGNAAVSYYAVAYSLFKMPQMILGLILVPLFTDLSRAPVVRTGHASREIRTALIFIIAISLVSILIIQSLDRSLLSLIYGKGYAQSDWILRTLSLAIPGLFLNNFTGVLLNSRRRERTVMWTTFGAMVVNLILNTALLPVWGVAAAVTATIATEYLLFCSQAIFILRGTSPSNGDPAAQAPPEKV